MVLLSCIYSLETTKVGFPTYFTFLSDIYTEVNVLTLAENFSRKNTVRSGCLRPAQAALAAEHTDFPHPFSEEPISPGARAA